MIQDQPIWKTNLENHWGLFTHTEYRLPASAHEDTSKKSKKEKSKPKPKTTTDTPFYFSKLKQEIKGTTICTPKGYGIIQSIDQDKNTILVKVQGQVYEFDKSEAITEIPLSVIYLKDSTKVEETVYLPVNSTLKEMFEKVESSVGTQEKDKIIDVKIFFQGKEITKSDETLEKLKIVPYSKFLTTYTPGKAYSVKRFTHTNQGWCVASNNNLDAIAFQASKNIRVIGFSVYPVMSGDDHPASIVLHAGDSTKHEQLCRTEVSISKEPGAPDTQPVKVLFSKPFLLKSGEFFSVGITFVTSGNSHYGNGGQIKMEGEGDVTFTFKNCVGANNGTGTSSGQIPEIFYYA